MKQRTKMKKLTAVVLAAAALLTVLSGCAAGKGGTVSTDGSTSMSRVIGALGEAFEAENSGMKLTYNATGSGSGIQAVLEGRCDIGLSSRSLKDEEKALVWQKRRLPMTASPWSSIRTIRCRI